MTEPADIVNWGVSTGRYSPARAQFWAKAAADERRRTGSTAQVEAAIRSLHPVYEVPEDRTAPSSPWTRDPADGHMILASGTSPAPGGETPLLDDLDRAMFGPTTEERYRAQDLAAEASLVEQIERERTETPGQLTEAEEQAIFGPHE